MALQKTDPGIFPEEYLLEEDEMGESYAQHQIIRYLMDVLEWLFRLENWCIAGNLELYHREIRNTQNKITPDISVFKGFEIPPQQRQQLTSWNIERNQAPPPVLFEISSSSTWRSDILAGDDHKPAIYGRIDAKEYFAFDPNQPAIWRNTNGRRLLGWRYKNGMPVEIQPDEQGRLWSEELDSWLKAEGINLRLYDRENNLRLTEKEADKQQIAELKRQLREFRGENNPQ